MKPSKLTWSGIALIVVPASIFAAWCIRADTRINKPIDMPIAMTPGHVRTPDFKVNTNRLFTIEIVSRKTIPFDALNCLLGTSLFAQSPCEQQSVISATWTLSSNGATVAQGTSETDPSGVWSNDHVAREIGSFRGESGRHYMLDVNVLTDGTALSATVPHLKIEVHPQYYEDNAFGTLFIFSLCAAVACIGVLITGGSVFLSRRKAKRAMSS